VGLAPTFLFARKMDKDRIRTEISRLSEPLAGSLGLELVAVEVSGSPKNLKLAIFLDKPDGLTLEDCSEFSRAIGAALETDELIPVAFTLEVSSPGLDRELKTPEELKRFVGKLVKVRTRTPLDGQRNFVGRLTAFDGSKLSIDDRTSGNVSVELGLVSKANLEIDLDEELNRG